MSVDNPAQRKRQGEEEAIEQAKRLPSTLPTFQQKQQSILTIDVTPK